MLDKRFYVYYDVYIEYKEVQKVNKEETRILKALSVMIPKLSEFQKGYLLGIAEAKADENEKNKGDSGARLLKTRMEMDSNKPQKTA